MEDSAKSSEGRKTMIALIEGIVGLAAAWLVFFALILLSRLWTIRYYRDRKRIREGKGSDEWLLKDLF